MLDVVSLFAGIDGFGIGLERTGGFRVVAQVEREPYCRAVLERHWPDVPRFADVRDVGAHNLPGCDVAVGGFPCQPISDAGLKLAQADERWLWPEFARIVRELRPRYVIVENVAALLARGIDDVLGDLAALGYDAEWDCIPAAAVGAPHRRDRVWIVAYPNGQGLQGYGRELRLAEGGGQVTAARRGAAPLLGDADELGRVRRPRVFGPRWRRQLEDAGGWEPEPDVGRVAHGVPARAHRLRALGNALVPRIPELIGWAILDYESSNRLDVAA